MAKHPRSGGSRLGVSVPGAPPAEYRTADDGGTMFRGFVEACPGREGEPRWVSVEGHLRKMTPELEKDLARLLAEALVADCNRRKEQETVEQLPAVEGDGAHREASYPEYLAQRLWDYRQLRFGDRDDLFDPRYTASPNPPVFRSDSADRNVIVPQDPAKAAAVLALIPKDKRHRWFRSMKSSQALALSIFGNLKILGHADALETVKSDGGAGPAFGPGQLRADSLVLEHEAWLPGERTSTSVDVLIDGATNVCVECKLSEVEIGSCSFAALPAKNDRHCRGTNPLTSTGMCCVLRDRGVKYWDEVPRFVRLDRWRDRKECPMCAPYQLVRNVLAANRPGRAPGHALLVYDARNPAFWPRESGTFEVLLGDLSDPSVLRRCSWQSILAAMMEREELRGLVEEIGLKYGLIPWPQGVARVAPRV